MPKPFEPTWESLRQAQVPQWFRDAKLGIFVHWGVYAVPAFETEWYPRTMYRQGQPAFQHHRETWGPQNIFGYKDFIPLLTGERFDPDAWAELFRRAGARYVVPVAEHHDGFAMYDSALTPWNAARMGPRRDVIGELAAAVRRRDLVFGMSYHRAENWWFFNGGREFDSDVNDPRYEGLYGPAVAQAASARQRKRLRNRLSKLGVTMLRRLGVMVDRSAAGLHDWKPRPDTAFLDGWLARCNEIVDRYQPQLVYFDWWIDQVVFQPYLQRFAADYYNRAQAFGGGVITGKNAAFPPGTAVFDMENADLRAVRPDYWQTDVSVGELAWGYVENERYKSAAALVHALVDTVSKNGNLLLNVGPKADGSIPEPVTERLLALGEWLRINGEAIYGTRPWTVFGENAPKRGAAFSAQDVRLTTRDNLLYAICLGWPGEQALIRSLGASRLPAERIERIDMLGSPQPLDWSSQPNGLKIQAPAERPGDYAYTFRLTLKPG